MARLKSYNRLPLEGGIITSWIRPTPWKKSFHVYFQKNFGGTKRAGLLSFHHLAEMVHAQTAISANWNRLTLSNFPEQAAVHLTEYSQWSEAKRAAKRAKRRQESQKKVEENKSFFDLMGLPNSQTPNSQDSPVEFVKETTLTKDEISRLISQELRALIL